MEAGPVILIYSYLALPIVSKNLSCYLGGRVAGAGLGCSACLSLCERTQELLLHSPSLQGHPSSGATPGRSQNAQLWKGPNCHRKNHPTPRGPRLGRLYSFQLISNKSHFLFATRPSALCGWQWQMVWNFNVFIVLISIYFDLYSLFSLPGKVFDQREILFRVGFLLSCSTLKATSK